MTTPVYPDRFLLVVGLGNPGQRYACTRHNMGFLWLDEWAQTQGALFSLRKSDQAEIARVDDAIFMKPQTFMNLSGDAVAPWVTRYHLKPECLLVVHDELDLPTGTVKFKFGGGAAGHNGLRDITQKIGSPKFWRLRVGIGRPTIPEYAMAAFVLEKIQPAEQEKNKEKARQLLKHWPDIQAGQLEKVIQILHQKTQRSSNPSDGLA